MAEESVVSSPQVAAPPTVSVIIPAFKVSGFIAGALDSVLAQSFRDFEIIVVDDGSPDTDEIADAIRERGNRISHLKQQNAGAAVARNTGLSAAKGRFVAFLDCDDIWEPGYLSEQVDFLAASGMEFVYSDAWIDGDARAVGRTYMEFYPSHGDVNLESLLLRRCSVITSAVVASRDAIVQAGMFDESFRYAEDLDLWLRVAKRGTRMGFQPKPLVRRRTHWGNTGADDVKLFDGAVRALEKLARDSATLSPGDRRALEVARIRLDSEINLRRGKGSLANRDFAASIADLSRVDPAYRSWKVSLAILALKTSPEAVYRAYALREQLSRARVRRLARRQQAFVPTSATDQ